MCGNATTAQQMHRRRASRQRSERRGKIMVVAAAHHISLHAACHVFKVPPAATRQAHNGQRWRSRPETLARHVAMYLAHTTFGVRLRDVAATMGVRPPSALKAIRRIEDMRDDPIFDALLESMEDRVKPATRELAA